MRVFGLGAALLLVALVVPALAQIRYERTNLVSDIPGLAPLTDPDLKDPWGISFASASPLWVSDEGTGRVTLYNGLGVKQPMVVTIPAAPGRTTGSPTGEVSNLTSDFAIVPGIGARFIFASLDGTISAWHPAVSSTAAIAMVQRTGAVYTGLTSARVGSDNFLLAANNATGSIDKFDKNYRFVGSFSDPTIPAGVAPYNIQNLNGTLYVTYTRARRQATGPGDGFVDVFHPETNTFTRLISGDPSNPNSPLNGPWGLALTPVGFGTLSNELLVGNFGDSRINAFDPTTGAFLDVLRDPNGRPLAFSADGQPAVGLWGLTFGDGGNG